MAGCWACQESESDLSATVSRAILSFILMSARGIVGAGISNANGQFRLLLRLKWC
jgi:hypothetical protein